MPTPAAPPTMPVTSASPMIWRMILRLCQPIALRVPNSRTRRETATIVRMLASPNAAASTATASQVPRLLARVEALASDPVTSLARLLEVVTVAVGRAREISAETAPMSEALGRGHVDGVHFAGHVRQGLRAGQRDVDVDGAFALRGLDDADDAQRLAGDCDRRSDVEVLCLGVVGVHDGDIRVRLARREVVSHGDRAGTERP